MGFEKSNIYDWLMLIGFIYIFIIQTSYFSFLILSIKSILRYLRLVRFSEFIQHHETEFLPPISILIPAYNEGLTIVDNVKGFIDIDYPIYEIIVINDGSKDETFQKLVEAFDLISIDKVYSNKLKTALVHGNCYEIASI